MLAKKHKWFGPLSSLLGMIMVPIALIEAVGISYCLYWIINYALFYVTIIALAPFYYAFYVSWVNYEYGLWSSAVVYIQIYMAITLFCLTFFSKEKKMDGKRTLKLILYPTIIYCVINIGFYDLLKWLHRFESMEEVIHKPVILVFSFFSLPYVGLINIYHFAVAVPI
jgi:hypothetical protein